jgi:hypothetical protein
MVCIGIPTVGRPLWHKFIGDTSPSDDRYYRHTPGNDAATTDPFHMQKLADDAETNSTKLGLRGTTTTTYCEHGHNESDEEILGPEFRRGQTFQDPGHGGIRVTEGVVVEVEIKAK